MAGKLGEWRSVCVEDSGRTEDGGVELLELGESNVEGEDLAGEKSRSKGYSGFCGMDGSSRRADEGEVPVKRVSSTMKR